MLVHLDQLHKILEYFTNRRLTLQEKATPAVQKFLQDDRRLFIVAYRSFLGGLHLPSTSHKHTPKHCSSCNRARHLFWIVICEELPANQDMGLCLVSKLLSKSFLFCNILICKCAHENMAVCSFETERTTSKFKANIFPLPIVHSKTGCPSAVSKHSSVAVPYSLLLWNKLNLVVQSIVKRKSHKSFEESQREKNVNN